MATEELYIRGKCKWAHVHAPNNNFGDPFWKIDVYPDNDSLEKLRELKKDFGLKNWERKDDDGIYFTFRRPTEKFMAGRRVALTPPIVLDKDDKLTTEPIGNTSDVTVKLEVYGYKTPTGAKQKAARLAAVRVESLVPFEAKRDFTDKEKEVVKGLAEQPKPKPF